MTIQFQKAYMEVSENRGTPKSSILDWDFPNKNHPAMGGTPMALETSTWNPWGFDHESYRAFLQIFPSSNLWEPGIVAMLLAFQPGHPGYLGVNRLQAIRWHVYVV